jgi:hypothetical protein
MLFNRKADMHEKKKVNQKIINQDANTSAIDPNPQEKRNKFPVANTDANCLIISSCFFLIPGFYAFLIGQYFYLATSLVTTIVSVNYWRDAMPGIRRDADLFVAKGSFTIYFLTGIISIRDKEILYIAWPVCIGIISFYSLANWLWEKDSCRWVYAHMCFHLFVGLEQYIVLLGSFPLELREPRSLTLASAREQSSRVPSEPSFC